MSTTYLAHAALAQIDMAQMQIDAHVHTRLGISITDPSQLYPRFLGWLLEVNQRCRVCAKLRHDAIPGVPPRLVPCGGRVLDLVRRPDLP